MSDDLINQIETQANDLFIKLGFVPCMINKTSVYEYKGQYYKFTFVNGLKSYIIEYANDIHDAQKNLYEDTDIIPIDLGLDGFITELDGILQKFYLN